MNIVHVKIISRGTDAAHYGNIAALKDILAVATGCGRSGHIAANEPFQRDNTTTIDFWVSSPFGLDAEYITAYLKAHLRAKREVSIDFITTTETKQAAVTFGPRPELTSEEILMLFRVVENRLSPENLSADGERPRSAVRKLESALQGEWAFLVRLLGREPTLDELYPGD
jgi:hypothetical protein